MVLIGSAFAAVLRGVVSPCRRCEFVEPTATKQAVETAQVNIKRSFHWCRGGLQDTSAERIGGKLENTVTDVYAIVLITARAVLKVRRVSLSLDLVSERNWVRASAGI